MTQRESLLEVDAKDLSTDEDSDVDSIIDDIRVKEKRYQKYSVQYQPLRSDEWNEICSLEEIPEKDLEIEDRQLEEDFTELQQAVQYAYDDERGMWRVEYETYEDGTMKSLYIPLDSPLTDDVQLCSIHDDKDDVKKKIRDIDRPLRSLYTDDLYVDSIVSINGEYIRTDADISNPIKDAVSCSPKEPLIISLCILFIGFPLFLSILFSDYNAIILLLSILALFISLLSCLIWISDLMIFLQSDRKLYRAKSTELFKID